MDKNMNKNKIEKVFEVPNDKALIKKSKIFLSVFLATFILGSASAGVPVVDAALNLDILATNTLIGTTNGNIATFQTNVTTQNQLLMALLRMQLGQDPTGNTGVIPQMLQKITGAVGSETTTLKQEMDNIHALNTSTEVQKLSTQYGMAMQPDMLNACGETGYATAVAEMNSGRASIPNAGTRGPSGGGKYLTGDQDNLTGAVSTEQEMAKTVLIKSANNLCSETDVANNVGKCTSVGTNPGADVRSKSLSQTTTDGVNSNFSLAYGSNDYKAAAASKDNLAGFSAAQLPKELSTTPAGVNYTANATTYTRRKDAVLSAAQDIIDFSTAPASGSAAAGNLSSRWASISANYTQLFPNQTPPAVPSERELLRYYVYSRYASPTWQADTANHDEVAALRELERMTAAGLYMDYVMISRLEKSNELLGALVSQGNNPITVDALNQLRQKALSNSN